MTMTTTMSPYEDDDDHHWYYFQSSGKRYVPETGGYSFKKYKIDGVTITLTKRDGCRLDGSVSAAMRTISGLPLPSGQWGKLTSRLVFHLSAGGLRGRCGGRGAVVLFRKTTENPGRAVGGERLSQGSGRRSTALPISLMRMEILFLRTPQPE